MAIPGFAAGPLGLMSFRELRAGPGTTMLAMGKAPGWFYGQPAFARLSDSGVLDPTFAAPNGVVSALGARPSGDESFGFGGAAPTPIRYPADVALQPDGRILILGERDDGSDHPEPRFTMTRLLDVAPGRVLIGTRASVRRRAARISVTCTGPPGAADCRGSVRITSAVRRRGERRVAFGRGVVLALAPGARTTVRVPLNTTALRRIRRAPHRSLSVRVNAAAVQRRVRLSATRAALR